MEILIALVTTVIATIQPLTSFHEVDVPIVMYHHIVEDEQDLNEFSVTTGKFQSDMKVIQELGYETISYQELDDFVNQGTELPEKPILITFDDGYESNYLYAYPLLKSRKMKATIAIIGNMVGKNTYEGKTAFQHFTYEEAREMRRSGLIDIQTHTYDLHDIKKRKGILRNENENENAYINLVKSDIRKAVDEIHGNLGNRQFVFTYPYGAHDLLSEKIMQEMGFSITVTTEAGINHIKNGDKNCLYQLKRFDIKEKTNIRDLLSE